MPVWYDSYITIFVPILQHRFFCVSQDYEDFDEANENGTLLEFLRIKTDEGAEDDSQKTPTQEGKNDTDSTEAVSAEGN